MVGLAAGGEVSRWRASSVTATLGNSISENLGNGVTVNGPGSFGNAIRRGVLVGGPSDADRNTITGNRGYGLFVTGKIGRAHV